MAIHLSRWRGPVFRLLSRLALAAAWLVVWVAALLFVVEESGLLTDLARAELASRLGPLGAGMEIEHVRLKWFEPGLVAEGVLLRPPPAAGAAEAPRPLLLRLDSVHLSIDPRFDPRRPLRRLRADGGRVRISDALFDAFGRFSAWRAEEGGAGILPFEPPSLVLTDIDVDLELPTGETLDLGEVTLAATFDGAEGYDFVGRLTPTLAGAVPRAVAIHVEGHQGPEGARLSSTVRGLPVEVGPAAVPAALRSLSIERFAGELSLTAETSIAWSPSPALQSEVRVSIADASLRLAAPAGPVEELAIELAATYEYAAGGRLWDRAAWSARMRIAGEWEGSPLFAHGEFGREAPGEDWAHLAGRLEALPVDAASADRLALRGAARRTFEAFSPVGTVDVAFDVALPAGAGSEGAPRWGPRALAHVRHTGRSGAAFHGWPNAAGEREGLPIPCTDLRGDLLLSYVPASPRPLRLGIVRLSADHGSGRVLFDGLLSSPDPASGFPLAELDLDLSVPAMAVDDRLRAGLEGGPDTRKIWTDWGPRGGTLSAAWRLHQSARTDGFTAAGDVEIRDASLAWAGLPVRLEGVGGHLELRWGERAMRVRGEPRRRHRPFGIAYRFANLSPAGIRERAEAEVVGFGRSEAVAAPAGGEEEIDAAKVAREWIEDLEVRVPALLLRGADWDVLAATFPALATEVAALGARGSVGARFRGVRPAAPAPYVSVVEVAPLVAEVTPEEFPRRTRDLSGRVLIRTETAPGGTGEPSTAVGLALAGSWPQGVELALHGEIPPRGPARLDVLGAGVDPTNTAFKGALATARAEGEEPAEGGLDSSGGSIHGRLDFAARTEFAAGEDTPPESTVRVHLRRNELQNGSLRLGNLRGVLEQRGELWTSPRLEATLAGHPLELHDVLVLPLRDASALPTTDPLLSRPGFWRDPDGFAVQAELHARDLPADEEHLASLVGAEVLAALRESATWTGAVDVSGARILLTSEAGGEGKVAIRGRVEPHDLAMRLGVPIEVSRGVLDIRELVFEQGLVRGWGEIGDLDARIADRRLSGARMIVGYVDGRLTIDDLTGEFEGGELQALGATGSGSRKALGIDLSPPYRFDVAVRLRNVPLDRLLRGVFPSPIADQGIMDLALQVSGTPGEVLGLTGSAWLRLEEGRLWSIPVMRELFHQLGFDETAIFSRLRARFELRNGVVETPHIEIKSKIVNLVGSGSLALDGALHYDLEMHTSLLDRLEGPNRLVYWLNNILWRVAVRGDMARPVVRVRSALLEILRPFRAPARALPLPAFAPLPRRF
ncbi:MAG: AsmA-like C-terminal region-containing protein [Planctomycetota bacterium]